MLRTWGDGYGYALVATGRVGGDGRPRRGALRHRADARDPRRGRRALHRPARRGRHRRRQRRGHATASCTTSCSTSYEPAEPHSTGRRRVSSSRSARARATRDRIVPMGTLAHLGRLGVGEPRDLREHEGLATIRVEAADGLVEVDARPCWRCLDQVRLRGCAAPAARPGHDDGCACARGRRTRAARSAGARCEPRRRPGTRARAGRARRYTSWVRSSASARSPRRAHTRHTSGWVRRTKAVVATRSPVAAASASAVSSSIHAHESGPAGNQPPQSGDPHHMRCDTDPRGALGPPRRRGPEPGRRGLDAHLDTCCRACAAWSEELTTLHRMVRVREAEAVPDLTAAILAAAPGAPGPRRAVALDRADQRRPLGPLRGGAHPARAGGAGAAPRRGLRGDRRTSARELGSFDVALAVGLLLAAWQPARRWGLFPVVAALGARDRRHRGARRGARHRHLASVRRTTCWTWPVWRVLWLVAQEAQGPPSRGRRRRRVRARCAPRSAAVSLGLAGRRGSGCPGRRPRQPGLGRPARRRAPRREPGRGAPHLQRARVGGPRRGPGARLRGRPGPGGRGPRRRRHGRGRPVARPARRHLRHQLPGRVRRRPPRARRHRCSAWAPTPSTTSALGP